MMYKRNRLSPTLFSQVYPDVRIRKKEETKRKNSLFVVFVICIIYCSFDIPKSHIIKKNLRFPKVLTELF